jgi:hypothetical protein
MLAFFSAETNDCAKVAFLKNTPNLNEMSDPHREESITKSRLHDWQKAEVRKANDNTAKYAELNFWHTLSDAKNAAAKIIALPRRPRNFYRTGTPKEIGLAKSAALEFTSPSIRTRRLKTCV